MSVDIRTTFNPSVVITVSDSEYQDLLSGGFIYSGNPPVSTADGYVNVRLTIAPTVTVTVTDLEYATLRAAGLIAAVVGGDPVWNESFSEAQYREFRSFASPAGEALRSTIKTLAAQAIGESDTVEDAIDDAVDAEFAKRNLIERSETFDSNYSFAITDEDGRRTWLEADAKGAPTPRVVETIVTKTAPGIKDTIGLQVQDTPTTGYSFSVIDEDGRRTWLEADEAGKPTPRVVALLIAAGVGAGGGSGLTIQEKSGPDIAWTGDSLTAGSGGGGTTAPNTLATLSGRTVRNLGVGGEDTTTIAGRVGARPWDVTVAGGQIPASGGVTVTLLGDDGSAANPLVQGSAGLNPVQIAGIEGTLSLAGGTYTFTRSANGAAVPVPFPVHLISESARTRRGDILIMEWGQNGGGSDVSPIIAKQWSMIDRLNVLSKRYLILGYSTGTAVSRAPSDAQYLAAFGRRFLNTRVYLSSTAALARAGITPTTQDLADIAEGRTPTSLRSDSTHLNGAGYALKGWLAYERLIELGDI